MDHLAQSIIETMRDPLLVLDKGLSVRVANRAFYRIFQEAPEAVVSRGIYELGNGQWNIPRLRVLLEEMLPQSTTLDDFEVEHDFPQIGRKTMLLNARHLVNQDVPLILLAIEDITERRRAERLVALQMQRLEWSNRELQNFAYIASHDLQEPLRAIQAFGERLSARTALLDDEARDYLQRMLRAAGRMRVLINDLLEFSRVTTKARPFTSVDLGAIMPQVVSDLARRIEETQGRVEAGALPTLEADATQMRQLLQNLVDNALKYRRDSAAPFVTIRSEIVRDGAEFPGRERDTARIEVRDNGIGFEEKYAERIFSPFQRLHGRDHYEGTGIGLAICRKIVERHGGRISAHSQPGEGSAFVILLPLRQSTE